MFTSVVKGSKLLKAFADHLKHFCTTLEHLASVKTIQNHLEDFSADHTCKSMIDLNTVTLFKDFTVQCHCSVISGMCSLLSCCLDTCPSILSEETGTNDRILKLLKV